MNIFSEYGWQEEPLVTIGLLLLGFVLASLEMRWPYGIFFTGGAISSSLALLLLYVAGQHWWFALAFLLIGAHWVAVFFLALRQFVLPPAASPADSGQAMAQETSCVGQLVKTLTVLRPTGKVQMGEEIFDAVTEGDFIAKDASVRIIRRQGNRLWVERVDHSPSSPTNG